MIANISKSGSSFYGAALYNQKKVDSGAGKIIGKQLIANTRPKQADRNLKVLSNNSRVKNPVFHVSLSFAAEEKSKLSNEKLVEISKDYMERMGYGKQPYIIYRHDDTAHPHVHILSTRVDIGSKAKINDSHERYRSRDITYNLELKHGLVVSYHRNANHKEIKGVVEQALKKGGVNYKQLNQSLRQVGSTYQVREAGRGIVYYKVDEGEKRNSKTWKGSDFKDIGIDKKGLSKAFDLNKYYKSLVKATVEKTLKVGERLPLAQFEKGLAKHGVTPKYAINENGVYGLSYEYKDRELKASAVDRNLSWNKIKDKLEMPVDMKFRESLKDSIGKGTRIGVELKNSRFTYSSLNQDITAKLNGMDSMAALELTKKHNGYIEQLEKLELPKERLLFKHMAGHDIDDYLQKQYEAKQVINQRQRRIGRW